MAAKLRTKDAFFKAIDGDKAWREKELTSLRTAIDKLPEHSRFLVRAAVPILYSHWEGFVKKSGLAYLDFVTGQSHTYGQLALHLLALTTRRRFQDVTSSKKSSIFLDVASFYVKDMSNIADVAWDKAFSTSNLNSDVLLDIILMLGLNSSPFEPFKVLIDEKLLKQRNEIAHGEIMLIDKQGYFDLHDEVLVLLNLFSNEIQNAVANSNYKKI